MDANERRGMPMQHQHAPPPAPPAIMTGFAGQDTHALYDAGHVMDQDCETAMPRSRQRMLPHQDERRQWLAHEAARWMAESGVHDYAQAKRKAARRLGLSENTAGLPRNVEIQSALREYQRLFQGQTQPVALRQRREAAARALAFFAAFSPRLTGPVLEGTADAQTPVILHLHAEDADAVARVLLDSDIPARLHTTTIRLDHERSCSVPEWHFSADGVAFELKVLPLSALHQAPLSALDDKPAPRANAAQVRALLETEPAHPQEAGSGPPARFRARNRPGDHA